jgi:isoleucyl-tRNA synthetase
MGCDVMRWMFCRQNPVNNLNFGYTPGDEVRRSVFDTLWNVYAFFCNYARLDGFDVADPLVPYSERPDIDRWLLSDLNLLVRLANDRLEAFDVAGVIRGAEKFVDNLSNWYVRRNRRRFWRAKGSDDRDKLAAYQTLHEAIVVLAKTLAPVIPFVTEEMYQKLVADQDDSAPRSIHLCDYPEPVDALIDEKLSQDMDVVTTTVSAVLGLRMASQIRVRQPLQEVTAVTSNPGKVAALRRFEAQILDELNVKELTIRDSVEDIAHVELLPRMYVLGPKHKSAAGRIAQAIQGLDATEAAEQLSAGESLAVNVDGNEFTVGPEEVEVRRTMPDHLTAAEDGDLVLILDTEVTPELQAEGWARDAVRHIQQYRKELDLNMEDRIHLLYAAEETDLAQALETWGDYIMAETLAVEMAPESPLAEAKTVRIGGGELHLHVEKASGEKP